MGTTTSGIVYPDASGVPGRAALVTLANTTDAILTGTGWVNMTLAGGSGTARYRVLAGIVFVDFNVTISLAAGAETTLVAAASGPPAAYRPTSNIAMGIGYMVGPSSGGPGFIIPYTTGAITCLNKTATAGTAVSGRYAYPVG